MTDGHRAKSGRWFSSAWWRGHWDVRDPEDGEYSDIEHLSSGRSAGEKRLHRQLKAERHRADTTRNERRRKTTGRREQLRDDVRMAQHDQTLRAERQAMGYKRETAAFYGSSKEATAEHSERRLTVAQADEEARKQAEHDRAERDAYNARRHGSKVADWYLTPRRKKGTA